MFTYSCILLLFHLFCYDLLQLTALMTGFYQSLSENLKDRHFMEQIKELGYLAHFQSFLSNHGN